MNINELSWRTLSTSITKIKSPSTFLQNLIYPNRIPRETNNIDIDIIVGNDKLAPFVSPIEGGVVIKKLGKQTSSVKAPVLRLKKKLPASMFSDREAGTTIYINKDEKEKAKLAKIAREQKDLKDRIIRRTEWMCAQSLKGSINVDQDNVSFNIDFGLPSDHKPVLTNTALWTDLVSDPLKNLRAWKRLINQKTGLNATHVILGSDASEAFLNNEKVLKKLDNKNYTAGKIELKGSNYLGNIDGLDIYEYAEQYTDDAGNVQYMIDPKASIVIAQSDDFELNFGAIEDLKAGGDIVTEFFSKIWEEEDPSAMWILADSHPLPVPKRVESIVYATVL